MQSHIFRTAALAGLAALALTACAPIQSGDVVNANQAQTASTVSFGTVTGSRPVTVQGGNAPASVVGTLAGGIAGAALGNQVGRGTGNVLATGAGAVAGAAAGNQIAGAATTAQSTEWFVRLDSGQTISVIQTSPAFATGQRVQVVQSGSNTRLVP
ncbi:glycine zipper 2TM domain-containing protein [Amaricoccus sp.]|uniref:glycine zipper 2TM domain-containing protein n=1 Tax=Amaricoccus sp. TaxID=1872485 RepID=UPI002633FCD5|nr:glycine zipper 2TM domain-containing protein [uncultured Amaricoccus sp.]